jgi:iron complex outermembrane recepter protein
MSCSIKQSVRRILRPWVIVSLASSVLVGQAMAEEQTVTTPTPAAQASDADLQEVVVTAQFRRQNLQQTPLAITAITAAQLEARGESNLVDVSTEAPNVNLRETGGAFGPGMSASIRGVGQADFDPALEPGVGIYIDDVYYPSLTGANFDLLDLDRVEILRGPQGVLGGRNSEGGSVKLYSKQPDGNDGGSVDVTYGSRNLIEERASADTTLIKDSLFLRISGVDKKQDGYVTRYDYGCLYPASGVPDNSATSNCASGKEGGTDYSAGRAALRWLPIDGLEFNYSIDVTIDDSPVAATVLQAVNPTATGSIAAQTYGVPYTSAFVPPNPWISYASFTDVRPDGTTLSFDPTTHTKVWGMNLTSDWTASDSLALKSITAYREFDSSWVEDNDISPLSGSLGAEHIWNHSFSEELRLNGKVSLLDYTVGAYYFSQGSTYATHQVLNYVGIFPPFLCSGPSTTDCIFEFNSTGDVVAASSYAGFANGSFHITDALTFNAGVRYTDEKKSYTFSRDPVDNQATLGLTSLNGYTGTYSGNKVDWRANLEYQWTKDLMTYLNASTAFKGGGINPRPFLPTQVQPFKPEYLTEYEMGIKSDFLDRKVRVNVAAFYNKFKDIQLTLLSCPQFSGGSTTEPCAAPVNAGNANIKGVEFEGEFHPIGGLSVDASVSYLNFAYTYISPLVNTPVLQVPVGSTAPGTITWKWSSGIQYEYPILNGSTITPRLEFSYSGGFNTNAVAAPTNRVAGDHLGTARVTWRSPQDAWEVSVQGLNIFNEIYYISNFDLTASSGAEYGLVAPPREVSLEFKRKF